MQEGDSRKVAVAEVVSKLEAEGLAVDAVSVDTLFAVGNSRSRVEALARDLAVTSSPKRAEDIAMAAAVLVETTCPISPKCTMQTNVQLKEGRIISYCPTHRVCIPTKIGKGKK